MLFTLLLRKHLLISAVVSVQLQVQPSPEPPAELVPRLCHLVKGERGYGFNLHSDKAKSGQFVRSVDPGSAADIADIRPGDRLVEVRHIKPLRTYQGLCQIRACMQM